MSGPLFRFGGPLTVGSIVDLDGDDGHHAASVRRMRVGESIQLTNGRGTRASGIVTSVERRGLSIEVRQVVLEAEPSLRLTLVQAIAKGDRDELAIQAATELGVTSIVPWQSERTVSRWDGKEAKGRERWQSIVDEAAKQSLRVWFPQVQEIRDSKGLAELVERLVIDGSDVFILDPTAQTGLARQVSKFDPKNASVAVIVGPEGGISTAELEQLSNAGAKRAHLGTGILRTSTAGMAALALLIGQSGGWD